MKTMTINLTEYLTTHWRAVVATLLIVFGAGGRLLLQEVPNIETIMLVSVLGGAFLGGRWGVAVAVGAVALSDVFIGNTQIFWFTWSAWAVIGFASLLLRSSDKSSWKFPLKATGMGIAGTLFFFAWTNFGVWLEGMLYPPTMAGLIESYLMAIPFLRLHLISSLTVVPAGAVMAVLIVRMMPLTLRSRVFGIESVTR
ncbi:MAG: hypothetical protein KC925_03105 [Candidatus Doudnabacteria bacterium]|nr:hypothetical protein [Candidatus Doudnabacteria bacterium]